MTKPYITTAIPYANAKPHIGNAIDYLLADIYARYQRQLGQEVRFQVGTDEHGNKIAARAQDAGIDPQTFVDNMYGNFETLMKAEGATYTDFVRTTDAHHKQSVQYIWQKLQPYIYKGSYEGWYCVGCEAFVTENDAKANNGICPDHNLPYEKLSEENYYFKLSAFGDRIKAAIDSGEFQIVPEFRKNEILSLLKSGLNDISISRPKKNLSWGIPVPGDDSQVMYVWIDALSNYLTVIGYPDDESWQEYWPAAVQVVGKDIIRFHAAIWPAMLLGLGLPLPQKLLVHGFVNVGGAKMSKTVGNVVDPMEIINDYGLDAFRYFFARHIPTLDDGDFTWEKFENAYNTELGNELGNVVQRVATMIVNYQDGKIGSTDVSQHDTTRYHEAMQSLSFDRALDEVWAEVRSLNQFLEEVKPWMIAKRRGEDPDATAHLADVLAQSVASLRQIAQLLVPFLPATSEAIGKMFSGTTIAPYQGVLYPRRYIRTPDPRAK
jgi:methionyl-tRNA synthetase